MFEVKKTSDALRTAFLENENSHLLYLRLVAVAFCICLIACISLPAAYSYVINKDTAINKFELANTDAPIVETYAFAVYSADDNSLNFYKRSEIPAVGDTFEGLTATAVYTGIEESHYDESNVPDSLAPWYMDYAGSVVSVTVVDTFSPQNTSFWFTDFTSCTSMNLAKLDTSKTIDMHLMFSNCEIIETLDVSTFNTGNATNMYQMFGACYKLNTITGIEKFDTTNVTTMQSMFLACHSLTSLDLSSWITSNVVDLSYMFSMYDNSGNGAENGKLASVSLSGWDVSKVKYTTYMFQCCYKLNSIDLTNWNTSSLIDCSNMFHCCYDLKNFDVSGFNTSNVTNMDGMFYCCWSIESLDLSKWDVSSVVSMHTLFGMYLDASQTRSSSLTILDLSGWNTSSVTDMGAMFNWCENLCTVYVDSNWTTANATSSADMFTGCTLIVGGNGTTYRGSYVDKTYARIDTVDTPGYFTAKETVQRKLV